MTSGDLSPERRETRLDQLFETSPALLGGSIAGFLATLATVPLILVLDPEVFSSIIAGMYGVEGATAIGAVAHMIHGTIFGFVFAIIMADPTLVRHTERLWKMILSGIIYGLILAIVAMGFFLPLYSEIVGIADFSFPLISPTLITWHVLYGLILGLLFPYFEGVHL